MNTCENDRLHGDEPFIKAVQEQEHLDHIDLYEVAPGVMISLKTYEEFVADCKRQDALELEAAMKETRNDRI